MAVRLTIDASADAIEAAADILKTYADRGPRGVRQSIYGIAGRLLEAASVERGVDREPV